MTEHLPGGEIPEEETRPTPNEAWTTTLKQKYQTYARRVVQFAVMNHYGAGHEVQLSQLRQATIQTILVKYKVILLAAGWTSCFLPATFSEVACRAEIGTELQELETQEYQALDKIFYKEIPLVSQAIAGMLDYAALRKQPITIFGTYSSCSCVGGQKIGPAEVIKKYIPYGDLEVRCPTDDTLDSLAKLVQTNPVSAFGGVVASRRSVLQGRHKQLG